MLKRFVTAISVLAFCVAAFSARAETIRISYSGTSGQNLPFWLTYDVGLFKKYGVPAELVLISGGLTNIQATLANEIRMAFIEGLHLYRQKKDYAMQVLEKYTKQSNPQILSQSYDYFAKQTPLVPLTDPAVIQNGLPADKPAGRNIKELYDNSLIQELVNEGFVEKISKEVR